MLHFSSKHTTELEIFQSLPFFQRDNSALMKGRWLALQAVNISSDVNGIKDILSGHQHKVWDIYCLPVRFIFSWKGEVTQWKNGVYCQYCFLHSSTDMFRSSSQAWKMSTEIYSCFFSIPDLVGQCSFTFTCTAFSRDSYPDRRTIVIKQSTSVP